MLISESNVPRVMSDEERPRFLSELQVLVPIAREAKEKAPKFAWLSIEGSREDLQGISTLVSMVSFLSVG